MPKFVVALCWLAMLTGDAIVLLWMQWLSWNCPQWLTVRNSDLNSLGSPDSLTMSPLIWVIAIVLLIAVDAVFVTVMDSLFEDKEK
jgi:ribose/xylose/arabinose/galactoside ABC-type transport system permease subunit